MNTLLKVIGVIALAVALFTLDLWMIQKIYGYVLIPHGAPALGMFQLWGVSLFLNAISSKRIDLKKTELEEDIKTSLVKTMSIAFGLALARVFFG